MRKEEFSAKTVEEAIASGLAKLNIPKEQAKIIVLEQGGFLKKAKVLIEDLGTEGEKALEFIEELYGKMGFKCTCELVEDAECATINVISVDSSAIIGYRGDVLDAVQYLASIVANEGKQDFKRIVIDSEDYRARRVVTLESLAKKTADKAVKSGRQMRLEPMNAFERRIIHSALAEDDRVTTASFGEEPSRYLTVTPKNLKPRRDFKKDGRGYGNRGGFNKDRNRDGKEGFNKDRREGGYNRDRRPGGNGGPRRSKSTPIEGGFSVYGYYGNSGNKPEDENK